MADITVTSNALKTPIVRINFSGQAACSADRSSRRYAPKVGVGIIDAEGFHSFAGLQGLDAKSPRRVARHIASAKRLPNLFSDLNPEPVDAQDPPGPASTRITPIHTERPDSERISTR
jgi:hypothetical protein